MTQFQDLPVDQTFGHEFNYAVWAANTTVTLANVPWNSDYRDIVRFENPAALDRYIDELSGPTITTNGATYAAMGRPISLDIPFQRANRFNYLRAHNPAQPIMGGDTARSFYYFVVDVQYVAPNTTRLMLQLDVWQTFGYGASFGNCYIEQGHIGVANENAMSDNGREYLTQPEGLDIGGEYQIVDQWERSLGTARAAAGAVFDYSILVTTTVPFDKEPGTIGAPMLDSAAGSSMENLPNGAETYLFIQHDHFREFMASFADKPWITQGIISIMAIPHAGEYQIPTEPVVVINGVNIFKVADGSLTNRATQLKYDWRDTLPLPERYSNLDKFKVYPYCVLEMTSYTGTPLMLKPESWSDPHATVVEVPHFAQPGPRLMFYPKRYNAAQPGPDPVTDQFGIVNDGGEFMDMATGIFNFPHFSTVNNGYQMFMASNAAGVAYQHSSADWSQQRALGGNEVAARQATGAIGASQSISGQGISAATQQTNLANEAQAAHTMLNGMGGILQGAGRGAMMGPAGAAGGALSGAGNAVMSGLNAAVDMNARNQGMGISNNLAAGVNQSQNDQAGFVRDSNKQYGDWAAQGDYQNAIAGVNAKVQDAKMIQPTTSGQVGGDAFMLATYKWGYDVKVKMLQLSSMHAIGEYWLRYGYKVNRFGRMPDSFMVCEKFTYWKLRETYITSSECPESFKQTLRGIFEKGVTVWSDPSYIGNTDIADNQPFVGVRL